MGTRRAGFACRLLLCTACAVLLFALGPVARAAAAGPPEKTDVMFLFDTSGSMGEELEEAKEKILEVMEQTNASLPNVEYAVSEVRDFAPSIYDEEEGPAPWLLDQPLTSDLAAVKAAIEPLNASGGGDGPEAYGRALWESDTNPNVGWRVGARHVIILVADNVPHDNDLNEGLPEGEWVEPSPWDTGEELPGTWGIPGTVWVPGTNMDFQAIARQLGYDGKPLESVEFFGELSHYLPYWEYWASLSGGHALNANSGELAAKVASLIETGATSALPACPAGFARNEGGVCVPLHSTVTQAICNLVVATASDTCTATVADSSASGATNPTGTVGFTSAAGGVFSAGSTCTLTPTPASSNTSSCSVQFLPPSAASSAPAIAAAYSGDATHNPSSASTQYKPADELAGDIDLGRSATVTQGGTVEVPVECKFPCVVDGELISGPEGAGTASVASHHAKGKAKKKHRKPGLLGRGKLVLHAPGKGKLRIKLSPAAKHALAHSGKRGVRVTLKVRIYTAHGTLVGGRTETLTLHKASRHKGRKHRRG